MADEKSILLIEMNERFREQIADYVGRYELGCVVARDFVEARALVRQRRFTGMFIDMHSDPERSDREGIKFVKEIKENEGPNQRTQMVITCESDTADVDIFFDHNSGTPGDVGRIMKRQPRVRIGGVSAALVEMGAIPPREERLKRLD